MTCSDADDDAVVVDVSVAIAVTTAEVDSFDVVAAADWDDNDDVEGRNFDLRSHKNRSHLP